MDEVHEEGIYTLATPSTKKKRDPTKLKTVAVDGESKIEVQFNNLGQPIGGGSVTFSSFLGPIVRELVPYTILDWRKLSMDMKNLLWQCVQVSLFRTIYYFIFCKCLN